MKITEQVKMTTEEMEINTKEAKVEIKSEEFHQEITIKTEKGDELTFYLADGLVNFSAISFRGLKLDKLQKRQKKINGTNIKYLGLKMKGSFNTFVRVYEDNYTIRENKFNRE